MAKNKQRKCCKCKSLSDVDEGIIAKTRFFCKYACLISWVDNEGREKILQQRRAEERLDIAKRKQALKSLHELEKEAQISVNAYVRARDARKPCCTCGKEKSSGKQFHAGHFISVGDCRALRFNPINIHVQCATCNTFKGGNYRQYREFMVRNFGIGKVLEFEKMASEDSKITFDRKCLERLKKVFNKRAKSFKL